MSEFNAQLYASTPSVTILDARALSVRQIEFYRKQVGVSAEPRLTYQDWNIRGALTAVTDHRLATTVNQPGEVKDYDLVGNVIRTQSTDSGTTLKLMDVEGRPLLVIDAAGNKRTFTYDPVNGNLKHRKDIWVDGSETVSDVYVWAGYSSHEKALNLGGSLIRHYDSAGCNLLESVSLTGLPLSQSRRLLDNPRVMPNWREDDIEREMLLSKTLYTTQSRYNTLGETIALTDAGGNHWRYALDINGRQQRSWLTIAGKTEQPVVTCIKFAANGQKQTEKHANGCQIDMTYEPDTLRLSQLKIRNGEKTLQELVYIYDPVGNILSISDKIQAPRFWNNQRTASRRTFRYDTLYQLVEASGRELISNTRGETLRAKRLSTNTHEYVNYVRNYSYDSAGNLIKLHHHGAEKYTRIVSVAGNSNRGVYSPTGDNLNIDKYFDVYGNQLSLNNGISLNWNSRGELKQAILVGREQTDNDSEHYIYDGSGIRVQKQTVLHAGHQINEETVCYLPGLEIHHRTLGGVVKEAWHVISDPITSGPRALSWSVGIPESIENHQLRYSYQDIISSVMLEVGRCGEIISQEEYFPFGGTSGYLAKNSVSASYRTRRFSGKERDVTGLYYYGYRYYNPEAGRWTSADPLGLNAGLNRYAFVRNNPVNSRDFAGLIRDEDLSPALLGAIGAIEGRMDEQYGNELFNRQSWPSKALNDERINPFAREIDLAAADTHAKLVSHSRKVGLINNLNQDDVDIINLYSQQSLPFHSIQLYMNSNFEFERDKEADGTIRQTYPLHYAGALDNALGRIPAYEGFSFRGAILSGAVYRLPDGYTPMRKSNKPLEIINVGDLVSTITYFSTSAERKVASEFALRQRFGNSFDFDTVVFDIEGMSGRNITELTHIKQAEILISPGAVFKVAGINRANYGVSVSLKEIDSQRAWNSGVKIRDYRFGYQINSRPMIPR